MKTIHFKKITLTLRWPHLFCALDYDVPRIGLAADTLIGFWCYRHCEIRTINWQINFVILGLGFQITDEKRPVGNQEK